jgi:hypothetical protein
LLVLHGAIVTLDPLGRRKAIARQIIDQGGNQVMSVKGNPAKPEEVVLAAFAEAFEADGPELLRLGNIDGPLHHLANHSFNLGTQLLHQRLDAFLTARQRGRRLAHGTLSW